MAGPITPEEARRDQPKNIPEVVYEVFNKLLKARASSSQITIKKNEVMDELLKAGLNKDEIYNKNWLDIEDAYRKAGWVVTYDKPGYNETYEASWEFTHGKAYIDGR